MPDNPLTEARDALTAAFGWKQAPDALAWRIAALIDDPADTWMAGTINDGQARGSASAVIHGTIVMISATAVTTIEFKNVRVQGEAHDTELTTKTRPLRDVQSIDTTPGNLDTVDIPSGEEQTTMPMFPAGWATITFTDGEQLALPLPKQFQQRGEGVPLGDVLHRITRAMGSAT